MAKATRQTDSIVSLKVTLRDVRPPIWRRLLVPARMTLGDLHHVIQAAMGWEDAHLHAFDIAGRQYGDPREVDGAADEARLTVGGVLRSGVSRFSYTYDFGDDWEHSIVIEGKRPPVDGHAYPACVAGRRNCPPEDCGGGWGYPGAARRPERSRAPPTPRMARDARRRLRSGSLHRPGG